MSSDKSEARDTLERLVAAVAGARRYGAPPQLIPAVQAEETARTPDVVTAVTERLLAPVNVLAGGAVKSGDWLTWLNPIAGIVAGLFGKSDLPQQPQFIPYVPPPKARYELGFDGRKTSDVVQVDRGERGDARPVVPASSTQVVVQVQAMDSRSFLDHTPEIAEAVRRALLESGGLPQVLREI